MYVNHLGRGCVILVADDNTDGHEWRSRLPRLLSDVPNLSEFSRRSGVNRRMLDRYKDGMEPSLTAAVRIMKALELPLDMLVHDTSVQDRLADAAVDDESIRVPLLDVVASAGHGIANHSEEVIRWLPFPRAVLRKQGVRPENVHFMTSRGDSMMPTIADGAIVLVDTAHARVRDDGIYALVMFDDAMIKRLQRGFDGSLTLISDNSDKYPPQTLTPIEAENLRVAGKVFWSGSGV